MASWITTVRLAIQPGFDPETIWNYEVGFKSRFANNRVRVGASAFYSDFKDLQVGQIVMLQSVLTNAAKAEIYGVEADVAVQPSKYVELGGTLAYLHAEFTRFCTADPTQPTATPQAGCTDPGNPINLSGFRLPRAPAQESDRAVSNRREGVAGSGSCLSGGRRGCLRSGAGAGK